MADRPSRSLAKGLSWRLVGTLDTILISFLLTGQIAIAAKIGVVELVTKFVLYYLHERVWNFVSWGRVKDKEAAISLAAVVSIAEEAGRAIMEVYHSEEATKFVDKDDRSPLTEADRRANALIVSRLKSLYPDIPIISEEEKEQPYETRRHWSLCWEVDPLDGTKEFLKRNGEFTVNIALLVRGEVVAGVIHAPALGLTAWAKRGHGAFMREGDGGVQRLQSQAPRPGEKIAVVASRSHLSPEVEAFVKDLPDSEMRSAGSSLKFLLVARGEAHVYPRLAPTMEWDTSAGQIILEEAGGEVLVHRTGHELRYNRENLLNPHFIAWGKGTRKSLD